MKRVIIICATALLPFSAVAEQEGFKEEVLGGYVARCTEVLTEKGYERDKVVKECECERNIVDEEFTTYSLLIAARNGGSGEPDIDKEKLEQIRIRLKTCKQKWLGVQ
jgi:hypothetical protein